MELKERVSGADVEEGVEASSLERRVSLGAAPPARTLVRASPIS
jgi:hypothetical protein